MVKHLNDEIKKMTEKQFIVISMADDFNGLLEKMKNTDNTILLSFSLKEEDLSQATGKKIINFFSKLERNRVKFEVSRPLPRCILTAPYNKVVNKFDIPKNCYECKSLFAVKDEEIISCDCIKKEGPKIYYMCDRKQVWEFFNNLRLEKKLATKCQTCLYFKRNSCDGLCFRL